MQSSTKAWRSIHVLIQHSAFTNNSIFVCHSTARLDPRHHPRAPRIRAAVESRATVQNDGSVASVIVSWGRGLLQSRSHSYCCGLALLSHKLFVDIDKACICTSFPGRLFCARATQRRTTCTLAFRHDGCHVHKPSATTDVVCRSLPLERFSRTPVFRHSNHLPPHQSPASPTTADVRCVNLPVRRFSYIADFRHSHRRILPPHKSSASAATDALHTTSSLPPPYSSAVSIWLQLAISFSINLKRLSTMPASFSLPTQTSVDNIKNCYSKTTLTRAREGRGAGDTHMPRTNF